MLSRIRTTPVSTRSPYDSLVAVRRCVAHKGAAKDKEIAHDPKGCFCEAGLVRYISDGSALLINMKGFLRLAFDNEFVIKQSFQERGQLMNPVHEKVHCTHCSVYIGTNVGTRRCAAHAVESKCPCCFRVFYQPDGPGVRTFCVDTCQTASEAHQRREANLVRSTLASAEEQRVLNISTNDSEVRAILGKLGGSAYSSAVSAVVDFMNQLGYIGCAEELSRYIYVVPHRR